VALSRCSGKTTDMLLAALVRQLVEIEYLLCLFAIDDNEPLRWASRDLEAVRKEYQPARMRERCGDRFRVSEYSIHCQVGGHPRFAAAYVLPEHLRPGPFSEEVIFAAGWVDLGQHSGCDMEMGRGYSPVVRPKINERRIGEVVAGQGQGGGRRLAA